MLFIILASQMNSALRTLRTRVLRHEFLQRLLNRLGLQPDQVIFGGRLPDRLQEAGWNVTEAATTAVAEPPVPTVYVGAGDGEQAAAESIGAVLEAPVEPRLPEIAEDAPGVIVLVTG